MKFTYHVRTKQGETKSGVLEAPSKEIAIEALLRNNFFIIAVEESKDLPTLSATIARFRGVPGKEVVIFSRQISTLFQAKVPLIGALKTMMEQTENQMFKDALFDIMKNVDSGMVLSKALGLHRRIFSEFYVNMVHSGEVSGKLEEVFTYLADGLEREYYLASKIKGAMTYPAFIIAAFGIVAFLMMVFVVPNLTSILKETGAELPLLTRVVVAISDVFVTYWWLILIAVFSSLGGAWYYIHTTSGSEVWDRVQLRIPIFGKLLRKYYIARFADSLSVLIQGGLPIVQALEVTAQVVSNTVYKEILMDTIEQVKKGNTISSVLKTKKEIPVMVSQMVYVGEESGKLDGTLKTAAGFYQKEVDTAMDSIVTIIEPVLILLLGAGVGVLVVAILMPMYDLAQNF
ncbi:hypothetical protein A3C91_01665 [Candidatus Azambacteria bacterium RIFCSPHIGHO2_02_FULL_52_12]|uniref:Type II secretion system protein GspF domain-containing protein n=1 Tax=Candidatus Azambacteria bacterium RIFCSPLOWO2_01_FULL_46_25 TaxID=1797298 RepID=A0A1F5BVC5_9BACT|nr:MAG: hypothetical protein A3C91_01665 [Candidatus Azambacteria bacterium RIFCSPHIGHO2_02_FULL_52_12]OGD34553.1 MAG: hypothetical protein A2988_03525 [Candidatus Azambacteria bacterium RIFCSPLOWO2_01_FULL_46_25]OGD36427.1 MAG: hypothetical protein A2850_02025 [Candidatus Azambacteria bacterium RIFCSPHIGHO2_01_FULL_51_74]